MQYLKNMLLLCVLLCSVWLVRAQSQQPSLFDDTQEQNSYLQNTVLKPGENAEEKIRSQIFIKTTISKNSCYVGEPVLVVYQLYTALYCQPKVITQPSFSGCSVVEMTTDEPEYLEKKDGKVYRVLLIRRVQLTPLQEGELIIPPAVVNNEVGFTSTDNPYRVQNYSAAVSSKQETVQVKALPASAPTDYSGITGKFTISAKADSTTIPQGENDVLQVTIAGEGNIDAIQTPLVVWPPGIEHFEGSDSQHINKLSFPVRGDKTFAIPFVGIKKGTAIISAVKFIFFNTASQKFETIVTQPIVITVTQSLPAKTKENFALTKAVSNNKYVWFVPAIALIVLFVFLVNKKKEDKKQDSRKQDTRDKKQETRIQETRNKNTSEQDSRIQDARNKNISEQETRIQSEKIQENKKQDASIQAANDKNISKQAIEKEKPDFKLLLQALSEAEDNYLFFTNAKTLLTTALQQSVFTTQQSEKELIKTVEENNVTLGEAVRKLYAICNQSLYSPAIDEEARTALIERLSDVIDRLKSHQPVYL